MMQKKSSDNKQEFLNNTCKYQDIVKDQYIEFL